MPAKTTVPPIRSRIAAAEIALTVVQADEQVAALNTELKAALDNLRVAYGERLTDLRKAVKTGTDSLERWAAGDLPNWDGRSLVFDNQIQIEFTVDPPHVEPTPQQRKDGPIVTAILGPDEAPDADDWAEAENLLAGLALSTADHARLRRRYLDCKYSLGREKIQTLFTEAVTASGARDREILTAIGLKVEQGETFRVKRAERVPSQA